MSDDAKDGQQDAHTPPGAAADAAALDLTGGDPLDLLACSPDLDATDLLAMAAEPVLSSRRARGRPEGSPNRKNGDMIRYLQALGHRDPWVTLSLIQTADTAKLTEALRRPLMKNGKQQVSKAGTPLFSYPDPKDVLALQVKAADTIMAYHHGKKPQQLELLDPGDKRPLMVIGEMNVTAINGDGFMSAGIMPEAEKPNEINGTAVRQPGGMSHENAKPLESHDNSGSSD